MRALLEGSVRKSGERLRVAVRLSDGQTGFQLWSGQYDRDTRDVFAVQDEIARAVVDALALALTPPQAERLWRPGTREVRAYDCYLRGRKLYERYATREVEAALQLFARAVELDPRYPQAHAGLADCWSYLYLYRDRSDTNRASAERASLQAVTLDPESAQAQASRGLALSLGGRQRGGRAGLRGRRPPRPGPVRGALLLRAPRVRLGAAGEGAAAVRGGDAGAAGGLPGPAAVRADLRGRSGARDEAAAVRRLGVERATRQLEFDPEDARALYMAANGLAALGERGAGAGVGAARPRAAPRRRHGALQRGLHLRAARKRRARPRLPRAGVASGLRQRGWCEHDSNLDPLRSHQRFQDLLRRL